MLISDEMVKLEKDIKEIISKKEAEKKIKNPNKQFVAITITRKDLFNMFGGDEEALKEINSLTDEQIEWAIKVLEIEENIKKEVLDKLIDII